MQEGIFRHLSWTFTCTRVVVFNAGAWVDAAGYGAMSPGFMSCSPLESMNVIRYHVEGDGQVVEVVDWGGGGGAL